MQLELLPSKIDTTQLNVVKELDKTAASTAELIKQGRFTELLDHFITWSIDFAAKLLIAILLFLLGRWIIGRIRKILKKIFSRRKMDLTLQGFLGNISDIFLYTLLFILIINVVGSQTVSLAAIIASAGLAIGLAVKDNLANFAGGVMLLFNKPFRGGDYIEAQNLAGTVKSVGVLYTTLATTDNKTIFIPNGPLSTGNIINYNTQNTRRVDITVSVEYGTDMETVKKMLLHIADVHPLVLKTPEPFARMTKMSDHSIDFTLRVWTESANYWPVTHDLNEEIYREINSRGFVIPYQQLTVHFADKPETVQ